MTLTPTEQAIVDVLTKDGPSNAHEIAERSGYSYRSLYSTPTRNIGKLRSLKMIHISDWSRQQGKGGAPVPVYKAGEGIDAKRPAPKSNAEVVSNLPQSTRPIKQILSGQSMMSILLDVPA